jgi:hypothetical protein
VIAPFDIFRLESRNTVVWLAAVDDLETAKKQVEDLLKTNPGEYIIRSLKTGHKILMKSDDSGSGTSHDGPVILDEHPGY